jgi:hypothetical protein
MIVGVVEDHGRSGSNLLEATGFVTCDDVKNRTSYSSYFQVPHHGLQERIRQDIDY